MVCVSLRLEYITSVTYQALWSNVFNCDYLLLLHQAPLSRELSSLSNEPPAFSQQAL